jgi:hypothetical protein
MPNNFLLALNAHVIPMAGNGAYSISYTAKKSGKYDISISVGQENIEGSPFQVVVSPGKPFREKTFTFGAALIGGTCLFRFA